MRNYEKLFDIRPSLLRRDRQGYRRTGNKMPVRRHPAALTGSEGRVSRSPRTALAHPPTAQANGRRPPHILPHRLTQRWL